MKNVLLKIAYDGTNYNGWQSGNTGISISNTIEKAIIKLVGEEIKIKGASRTDSGVHALCNYATFLLDKDINIDKIYFPINNLLPKDISIISSKEVDLDYDVRKNSIKKTYEYRIYNTKVRNPVYTHFAHFVYYDIDVDKMKTAAKYLIGEHDFRSFANPLSQVLKLGGSSVRTIYSIDIEEDINSIIKIRITGNGFLYHMIRIISGTLLKIGNNMWEPIYIKEILEKKDRRYAGWTLPANGLILANIELEK